jgi:hypothetical protein
MAKIYASGNYVIVEDGDNLYEYAKGHTLYVLSEDVFYIKEITQGQYKVSVADLDAGNITAEDSGDVYNVATFTTFLRENTGFKTAPGGSGATPIGATLMKTGQTTSYRTGDDGDIEAGRATSFTVLASNNPFGNTNRFTDTLGGQTYTNNIVIDWSTYNGSNVLGWYKSDFSTLVLETWNAAIDNALALTVAGFATWKIPNLIELFSIMNFSSQSVFNYAPFNNTTLTVVWSSTTDPGATSGALIRSGSQIITRGKTSGSYSTRCRTFTVTGTTLT